VVKSGNVASFTGFLSPWRGAIIGTREVLEGRVAVESGPSSELARALSAWDGHHYLEDGPDGRWLVLVRETSGRRERWWLHALLLLLTAVTTTIAGAAFAGAELASWGVPSASGMMAGLRFSLPLLAILLAHESGHFAFARRYRVDASPPYFLPLPPQVSLIGTLGAFIRLRSPLLDRRTLFDIAVAGPIAGMLVALPALVAGLALSATVPGAPEGWAAHQLVPLDGGVILLGDSLLLHALRAMLGLHGVLLLHPLAIAGWVGLLVTMLNLLPLAQLDGGHITFALLGRAQRWVAWAAWAGLVALGFVRHEWWVWAALALVVGRGRLAHPAVLWSERTLTRGRRTLGWLAVALLLVTIMPTPVVIP
jgi:membrane-associated protease RseP (regulator of RpoE activity)